MGGHKGGRKRIPTALHLLQGGRKKTHRPMPVGEPMPPALIPKCPKHLDAEARKEWRRIGRMLLAVRVITELDRAVLTVYCQSWSEYVRACEALLADLGQVTDLDFVANAHGAGQRRQLAGDGA